MAEQRTGQPRPEGVDYRRITRGLGLLAAALAVVGGAVGYWLAGGPGLIGALIAAAITGAFFTSSGLVMHFSKTAAAQARNLLITWFAKLIVLFGVLLAMNSAEFINRPVFGVTILAGIIGSLVLEGRVVWSARIPPGEGAGGGR
ncbi:MAG: hypothetical protein LBE08_05520 [Bifidobacteriaceae bacterium]|jgi:hypothetical protein|nr:hypothetical protein [Bifidobacteriaceae bacterium]